MVPAHDQVTCDKAWHLGGSVEWSKGADLSVKVMGEREGSRSQHHLQGQAHN